LDPHFLFLSQTWISHYWLTKACNHAHLDACAKNLTLCSDCPFLLRTKAHWKPFSAR
jgi:hypothetical protein